MLIPACGEYASTTRRSASFDAPYSVLGDSGVTVSEQKPVRPVVLGASPREHNPLSIQLRKLAHEAETRLHPAHVLRRCPVFAGNRVPREVEQVRGAQIAEQANDLGGLQEVDGMPRDALCRRAFA